MSASDNMRSAAPGGLGLGTILLIIFVTLKLAGSITWSWVWVLSPLWIPFALTASFLLLMIPVFAVAALISTRGK